MGEGYKEGQMLFRAECDHEVYFHVFRVAKLTPKGAWIVCNSEWEVELLRQKAATHPLLVLSEVPDWTWRKWVPLNTKYASTTQEEAVSRLYHRTRSYIGHCKRRLKHAEAKMRRVCREIDKKHPYDEDTSTGEEAWDTTQSWMKWSRSSAA